MKPEMIFAIPFAVVVLAGVLAYAYPFLCGLWFDAFYWLAARVRCASWRQDKRQWIALPTRAFCAAVTNICNARCIFCAYPRVKLDRGIMSHSVFMDGATAWSKAGGKHIDLTPTVGDPLIDGLLTDKIRFARKLGMTVSLTTNAILLFGKSVELLDAGLTELFISLPSLDSEDYRRIYGVDKCKEVGDGIAQFLNQNKGRGEPCRVHLRFRNAQRPSRILASTGFIHCIEPYLSKRVTFSFTPGFDNWGGAIEQGDMVGVMRLKKPIQSNAPCAALFGLSMRHDGALRACACRFVTGDCDDLIVGHINEGFEPARRKAAEIANGFLAGRRPQTCQKCTLYHPATK